MRFSGDAAAILSREISAGKQEPDPGEEVEGDDEPEEALVGGFLGFVAEELLGEEGTGPAADEFEEMEGGFGGAFSGAAGAEFVPAVDWDDQEADDKIGGGDPWVNFSEGRCDRERCEKREAEEDEEESHGGRIALLAEEVELFRWTGGRNRFSFRCWSLSDEESDDLF